MTTAVNEEDKARAACVGPTRTEELSQGEGADLLGHSGPRDTSGSKVRPCPVPRVFGPGGGRHGGSVSPRPREVPVRDPRDPRGMGLSRPGPHPAHQGSSWKNVLGTRPRSSRLPAWVGCFTNYSSLLIHAAEGSVTLT